MDTYWWHEITPATIPYHGNKWYAVESDSGCSKRERDYKAQLIKTHV